MRRTRIIIIGLLSLLCGGFFTANGEDFGARECFVMPDDSLLRPPHGLSGANIAVWQSHGWYFEPKLNRWEWQRARIFQTVEDLYTQSYVMPFLMPMLENAGAYVVSPRERDVSRHEIIVDADGGYASGAYIERTGKHKWKSLDRGFAYTSPTLRDFDNPFRSGTSRRIATDGSGKARAIWQASIPEDGQYAVYVSYVSAPDNAPDALYRVHTASGIREFRINQRWGGGTWIYLGHFPFEASVADTTIVELIAASSEKKSYVSADAVKIGGGMGNVERKVEVPLDSIDYEYQLSGYPRFTEGARYWLQWAGAPDSVFTESRNVNDYTDDYKSRGLWVNWLTGGSASLPSQEGLGIPIDLSLALHSDAGTTMNDSIIGTLGIYCTKGDTLGDGSSRETSGVLTDMVMTSVVEDIRRYFEPEWTRRDMWNKSYHEARAPMVPAMLLELLSHQNFADMKYGLDPTFRFAVSRSIYKGILKYLSMRSGREYVVQPLPVKDFAILPSGEPKSFLLSWKPTGDESETTAFPTRYIVEERIGDDIGFRRLCVVDGPQLLVSVADTLVHSYRIIAANEGGVSFPSEVLALADVDSSAPPVMIVNGFTRVSGPDWFDSGEIAGFYDARDHGVPYVKDISFIGSQFEYRRDIPWMDDDAAGFGASHAAYEDKVVAGNTFDFVALHGKAVASSGRSFISSSVGAFERMEAPARPMTVDLILGKQKEIKRGTGAYGSDCKSFPAPLQETLRKWTDAGCGIFVSGSFIATDLWDNPFSSDSVRTADMAFAGEVLGYKWRVGQASVEGQAYVVPSRFRQFKKADYAFCSKLAEDCYIVESPDSFYPADASEGAVIMRYSENNLVAGVATSKKSYSVVALGFPFEVIESAESQAALMSQILNFLEYGR